MKIKNLRIKMGNLLNGFFKKKPTNRTKSKKKQPVEFILKIMNSFNPTNPKNQKRKAGRLPKQIYSFKGSAYNGKGSVNADAKTFHNSRG